MVFCEANPFTLNKSRRDFVVFFSQIIFMFFFGMAACLADVPGIEQQKEYQSRFEDGAKNLLSGNYLVAAGIFEKLYADTHSQRVKLEWARSLYFLGEKEKAKKLFEEVLAANPPLPVREKIRGFINDIAITEGKFDYSFGIIRDTNPRFLPNDRTFYLFGSQLNYTPQFSTSPQYGMSYNLSASKGFGEDNRFTGSLTAFGTEYRTSIFNQNIYEAALAYRITDEPKLQTRVAYETMSFGGEHLYDYPSLGFTYTVEHVLGDFWSNELKGGNITYPSYSYLSGPIYSYTTSIAKSFAPQIILGVELYTDTMNAVQTPYAYRTNSLALYGNFRQENLSLHEQIRLSVAKRNYGGVDPFFGQVRSDTISSVMATLTAENIKIYGSNPALELGYQKNSSNINFYTYGKVTANIYFKKSID